MFTLRRSYQLLTFVVAATVLTLSPLTAAENVRVYALSLTEFVDMALKNSLRSRSSEASYLSAKWGWKASRRSLSWPSLSGTAERNRAFTNDDLGSETDTFTDQGALTLSQPFLTGTQFSVTSTWTDAETDTMITDFSTTTFSRSRPNVAASITQPLFIFTGNQSWRSKKVADLQWANDQDSYRSEVLSIEFDSRTRYYNLLLQKQTTQVEKQKNESSKLVNDVTRALVRAGKLAEVEAVRSDIRSKKDLRRIQNSENALEKAMNEAKDFLYIPASADLRLTSSLSYRPFRLPLETVMAAALAHNPALQISKRKVELSEIDLKNTREVDRPKLNAIGRYERERDRSVETIPVNPYSWTIGLGLEWTIFDASQTKLKTRQSEVSLENTKRDYEDQSRQLRVDVENLYLEIKRTEEQISDFEPQRVAAQRNVNAIRLQYRNGLTRLTDVFDAENEMRDLELEYLGLLVDFNTARDRLKLLVGKDLTGLGEGTP